MKNDSRDDARRPGNAAPEKFPALGGGKTKSNAIEVPAINLPKGGGAVKGIDEKFTVNAVNGTAGFSIPLPFSRARGAAPPLNLSYNSGSGNGIFGLGWKLSLPRPSWPWCETRAPAQRRGRASGFRWEAAPRSARSCAPLARGGEAR